MKFISGKDNAVVDTPSGFDTLSPWTPMDAIPVYQITSAILATDNWLDRTRNATTADPALHFPCLAASEEATSRMSAVLLELS